MSSGRRTAGEARRAAGQATAAQYAELRKWAVDALGVFRRYPEVGLLAALLLLTSIFSREFSKGASIGPIYVTEVVMVLSTGIALHRQGVRRSWALLQRVPLLPLALIWVVGAIATLRGLSEFSRSFVENDIGLVDYTLLLPILALLAVDRERFTALYTTLVACGFAGIATFFVTYAADQVTGEANTLFTLQGSAAGLYMSLAVIWVAARLVNGVPTSWWLKAVIPVGLVMMGLTTQRSVWMIAIVSLAIVGLFSPRPRLRTGIAIVAVLIAGLAGAIAIQAGLNATVGGVSGTGGDGDNFATTSEGGGTQLGQELSGLGGIAGGEGDAAAESENVSWRLAYWKELLSRVPDRPVLGAGFGEPAAFFWDDRKYDFRDGRPGSGIDVAGPHNSFVNFVYRLGIPAFLALMFVIFVALRNAFRAVRGGGIERADRVALSTLVGMLAAGAMASSFNEGLTGPFLGLFFWVPLGMLLLWPFTRGRENAPAAR